MFCKLSFITGILWGEPWPWTSLTAQDWRWRPPGPRRSRDPRSTLKNRPRWAGARGRRGTTGPCWNENGMIRSNIQTKWDNDYAYNSTIHSPARISLQLSSDIVVNLDSTRGLTARATIRKTTRIVILILNVADTKATSSVGFTVFLPVLCCGLYLLPYFTLLQLVCQICSQSYSTWLLIGFQQPYFSVIGGSCINSLILLDYIANRWSVELSCPVTAPSAHQQQLLLWTGTFLHWRHFIVFHGLEWTYYALSS